MFTKDFYPTPNHVLDLMQIDCFDKVVLEPSAGKGNIIDYLKNNGAKEVLSCEENKDLAEIVKTKSKFIGYDFLELKAEQVSHIDLIVMNPPFAQGIDHVLHAWDIMPEGCELISLGNYDNYRCGDHRKRYEFRTLVDTYGSIDNLGDVFKQAERTTDCDISLIKMLKARTGENEFQGFFLEDDIEEPQGNGIMPYNSIRDVVQRYIASVKCYDDCMVLNTKLNELNSLFHIGGFTMNLSKYHDSGSTVQTREDYKKGVQKAAWKYIFGLMNLEKYVTSGVMRDINSFVETQTKIPFTMQNIYRMFDIIIGTREETFNKSLVEAIDRFTKHTDENRYHVEGWKTNSGHLLNRKFIVPYIVEIDYNGNYLRTKYSTYREQMEDLVKVICSLTGTNYDTTTTFETFFRNVNVRPNTWYSWGFFEIKGFKKGTLHIKFQNEQTWAVVNRAYAKIKGMVLPEKF